MNNGVMNWSASATLYLQGAINNDPTSWDTRFSSTLRECLNHCCIAAKPLKKWLMVQTDDGAVTLLGPQIEAALAEKGEFWSQAVEGKDDPSYDPRRSFPVA
jgi:hypothetical protein